MGFFLFKGPNHLDERVPVEVGTIQVNFGKNPQCQNFGVPARTKRQPILLLQKGGWFSFMVSLKKARRTPIRDIEIAERRLDDFVNRQGG